MYKMVIFGGNNMPLILVLKNKTNNSK